jgi:signal transduction histidine kinase
LTLIAWVSVAAIFLVLAAIATPLYYSSLVNVCTSASCAPWQSTVDGRQAWPDGGLPINVYAAALIALQMLSTAAFWLVALVLIRRRPNDHLAFLLSLTLVLMGTLPPPAAHALVACYPFAGAIAEFGAAIGWASFFTILFFLFPDGHFIPGWTKWPAIGFYAVNVPAALSLDRFAPDSPLNYEHWPPVPAVALVLSLAGAGVYAQIHRYRRHSDQLQRQQAKWVVFAMTVSAATLVGLTLPGVVVPSLGIPGFPRVLYGPVGAAVVAFAFLPVPIALGIAIVRYRLWDIDIIINRSLVYAALSVGVVGLYVLVVGALSTVLHTADNIVASLLAAGVVAVLFQPLRASLQRGVNHLMYGERDDPYTVLSRLGRRLEASLSTEDMPATVVHTVAEALKLPYAAIAIAREEGLTVVAAAGSPVDGMLSLPLVSGHEIVGELRLGPRAAGERFSTADHRLFADLTRQAGIAAQAMRLTADLQRARERLVRVREEERRRLRRDLHDGLGPLLAGQRYSLDALAVLIERDPDAATALLANVQAQSQSVIADIRRLVQGLRPPALDDLGLEGAIRAWLEGLNQAGLSLTFRATDRLVPLAAAVEVAAYRIIQEAVTNVLRHARSGRCAVSVSPDPIDAALVIEIVDDGQGLPDPVQAGVGLISMRERAEELGGSVTIRSEPGGGTRVSARLPLPEEAVWNASAS